MNEMCKSLSDKIFNSTHDNNIENTLRRELNLYNSLEPSPVIRNGDSYFTFSSYQDTEPYFQEKKIYGNIKKQECIRYINKLDLTNPLCINIQVNYSIQNYQIDNHCNNIEKIIKAIAKSINIDVAEITIEVPSIVRDYFKNYTGNLVYIDNYKEANLGLAGWHIYLRVYVINNQEKFVIGSLVLVDLNNNVSQLDSIFHQERLGVIYEKKNYIFQREKYRSLYLKMKNILLSDSQIHRIFNDFITISCLLKLNINFTNKGVGNELTRKVKELYIFIKYYCTLDIEILMQLYEKFLEDYKFSLTYKSIVSEKIYNIIKQQDLAIVRLQKAKNKDNNKFSYETLGIPKEYFGYRKETLVTDYNFYE